MIRLTFIFNSIERKLLVDAAPLLGTSASYAWMRDMIKQSLLSDMETDMWMASLAFQTNPTLDMIIAVTVSFCSTLYPRLMSIWG